jgi:GAF domain-containing protein
MIAQVRHLLAPPSFAGDEDKTRIAGILNTVLWLILAGGVLYGFFAPEALLRRVLYAGGFLLFTLPLLFAARRGHLRFAGVALVGALWLVLTVSAAGTGGVRAPAFGMLVVVILSAGLLIGRRSAMLFALLCILSGALFLVAQDAGVWLSASLSHTDATRFIAQMITFSIAALLLNLATGSMQEALRRARHEIAERKKAEAALQRYAARMELLHEMDSAILAAQSPRAIAEAALSRIRQLVPVWRATVTIFEPAYRQARVLAVDFAEAPASVEVGMPVRGELFDLEALRQGRPMRADDLAAPSPYASVLTQLVAEGVQSILSAPLLSRGELIGTINLEARAPRAFNDEHLEITREVANPLAIALQQARLSVETHESLAREQRLNEVARVISTALDLDTLVPNVVRLAAELLGADAASMDLLAPDGQTLIEPYHFNYPASLSARQPSPKGVGVSWAVIDARAPLLLDDYAAHPLALPEVAQAGLRACIGVPVIAGERCLGALGLFSRSADKQFSPRDLALAEALGRQAGVAIQNARLFEAQRAARARADALVEAARVMTSTLSLPELVQRILAECVRITNCVSGAVIGLEQGAPKMMAFTGYGAGAAVQTRIFEQDLKASLVLKKIIEDPRPLVIGDVDRDPSWTRVAEHGHIRSWLGMPLLARERLIGVLSLDSDQPQAFTPMNVEDVQAIAAQAAIAVENARLFEAEHTARRQAEVLRLATLGLSQSLALDTILASLLDHVRQLVPYDSACIMLLEADVRLVIAQMRGYESRMDAEAMRSLSFVARATPNLQTVIKTRTSFIIDDVTRYPGWIPVAGQEYIRSWLGVPLIAGDRVIGLFSLDKIEPRFFSAAHVHVAEALAAQATIAIQNARLFEQVSAAQEQFKALSQRLVQVQEEERRHLARELHDEIGQQMTGLKLMLELIPRMPPKEITTKTGAALELVNQLMTRVHALSLDLRPAMLDDLGLLPALLWLFERYSAQTGVRVHPEFTLLDQRLPAEVETTAYRIIQEALTNVARHARVDEARVRVLVERAVLRIQIQDEGVGFDAARVLASGARAGLAGIRERVALLGGQLNLDSAPGAGARVTVVLPLHGDLERNAHEHFNSLGG